MDPAALTQENWAQTSQILITVWLFFGAIFFSTTSLILGYAVVPSLVESKHLPQQVLKLRPLLILGAIAFFVLALFFIISAATQADFIGDIYRRWWI